MSPWPLPPRNSSSPAAKPSHVAVFTLPVFRAMFATNAVVTAWRVIRRDAELEFRHHDLDALDLLAVVVRRSQQVWRRVSLAAARRARAFAAIE
jgi:hypothetical protein